MSPTARGSRRRDAVGAVVVLAAMGAARLAAPYQAPPAAPSVLTAVVGPRQGTWTRSFNPFRSDAESRWPTWAGIYEPLLISNRATGTFTPWLASAYSWSADNLTFRVTTRPGVRWSDGQPFSARDVAFTFDLMRRFPALDHDAVWLFLADVAARDAQTVEFKLKRPYTPGAVYLGEQAIVPEHK
jgi:peptide/nickel transport system substrate-binding protein